MARSALAARWAVRVLLVPVSGAAALTAVPALASSAAPAASTLAASVLTLNNDGASVKTSNGQSWFLSVSDTSIPDTMTAGIVRPVTAGGTGTEQHVWYFDTLASALTFDKSTGVGTLKGGSATSPVGAFDLTFKATSHAAADCSSGSETIYTGTLSGEAEIVTGLTGGGTVGGKSVTFNAKGSSPHVLVDSACVPVVNECLPEISFSSAVNGAKPEAAGVDGTEEGIKTVAVAVASKTTLTSPKGSYRIDDAEVDTSPPIWNAKTGVLSVTTTSAGIVTGSATVSGGTVKNSTFPCSYKGVVYTMHLSSDTTANYTSPAGKDITAHTSLTGNLVAEPTTGVALVEVLTASK
jgi:hypothetical protein